MMPDERTQLLALLEHVGKWWRNAEALDASGNGVVYDDAAEAVRCASKSVSQAVCAA